MDIIDRQSGRYGFVIGEHIAFDTHDDRLTSMHEQGPIVRLHPVDVRVLLYFVNHPQVLLRRRQIFDQCWREYRMEVCDNSLSQVVHSLREALRSIDPTLSYIKTVPRIGYALTATVRPWEEKARTALLGPQVAVAV